MVSLWPWRQDQTSAESFEKTLSAISVKISKASAHNDRIRQRARKFKVGWTLYGGFMYIVCALIFTLVTGWRNWGTMEYTVTAGGPVILYAGRYILTSWYNYRISNASDSLESLHKEKDSTIEKLKLATKYNSTQQLLEKYGGAKPASKPKEAVPKSPSPKDQNRRRSDRTSMAPPATANIPRRQTTMNPENQSGPPPISPQNHDIDLLSVAPPTKSVPTVIETAEFAPNAFDSPTQFAPAPISTEPKWYDRLVNALLGEDETRPDRRLALICTQCRLVNGLAPPGALTLEEVGKWKCSGCGTWNGIEAPVSKPTSPVHSRQISAAENPEVLEKLRSQSPESSTSSS